MKRTICLVFLLTTTILRAAIGLQSPAIQVIVTDFTLDYTPEGRTVRISPHSGEAAKTGTTDSDGQVTFANVTPGLYQLRIWDVGLSELTFQVPNQSGTINVTNLITSDWTPPLQARYASATENLRAWSLLGTNPLELPGALKLSGQSNELSIAGGSLLLDGAPITGGGGDTVWTNDAGVIRPVEIPVMGDFNIIADQSSGDPATLEINFEARPKLGENTNYAIINLNARAVAGSPRATLTLISNDPTGDNTDIIELRASPGETYFDMLSGSTNLLHVDPTGISSVLGFTTLNLTLTGTTNQVTFGGTNTAPADAGTIVKWISVQVTGRTNAYRLPLYE